MKRVLLMWCLEFMDWGNRSISYKLHEVETLKATSLIALDFLLYHRGLETVRNPTKPKESVRPRIVNLRLNFVDTLWHS